MLDAIQGSIVTNPVTDFGKMARLVPETSIVMLKAIVDLVNGPRPKVKKGYTPKDLNLVREVGKGIEAILDKVIFHENIGDILEVTLQQALHIRIRLFLAGAARARPHSVVGLNSLARLCGLENTIELLESSHSDVKIDGSVVAIMNRGLVWDRKRAKYGTFTLKTCSYSSPTAFVEELKSIKVNATSPFVLILPHEQSKNGEAWDVCIKCFVTAKKPPFYIFFDAKSGGENLDKRSTSTIEYIKSKQTQYRHTERVLKGTGFPFLYAYFSTYDGDSCVLGENGIVVGRNDSFNTLGPLTEFYQVARDAVDEFTRRKGI
jgi:hypothetical protein